MRARHILPALLLVQGCAEGSNLPNNSGSSNLTGATSSSGSDATSATSSSTGAGAAGGMGGAGGNGGGGAGGNGSGGAGGNGSGSGSGSGGAGGNGSGSGSGSGGAGGSGSGSSSSSSGSGGGGGGGAGPTGTLLVAVGPDAGEAHYQPATGWATGPLTPSFSMASLAPTPTGAMALMRRQSAVPAEVNELFWATWTPAAGFGAGQKVGNFGFAKDGPDVAQAGVAWIMTFLGTDNKHYYAQHDAGMFGAFGPIPAGAVDMQAFGPSTTALANDGVAGVYAVYAGDDSHLYYVYKPGPGSVWSTSSQAPSSLVTNTLRPFALVDSAQDLRIFYVRQSDSRVCMVKLITPQNAWSAEETVGTAASSKTPSATETASGDFVVAYHGLLNEGAYFVRGKDAAWGGVTTIDVPATTTTAPVALRGLAGADAEVVYATGGKLKHARVKMNAATVADVPGPMNVTNLAAVIANSP